MAERDPQFPASIAQLQEGLGELQYVADRGLSTSLFLALKLQRPLLLEGEAGVGKTEVGKSLARLLDTQLIRLQCYEGLDVFHAVYDWNYSRQMLHLRVLEARGEIPEEKELFGPEFLLKRPLLEALENGDKPPVLLIDEIDRSDVEFEAYLLEVLSDFQITIPEIGTIRAESPPHVIITSNRTREIHDALKRRCLYHWIEYPDFDKELAIVHARVPKAAQALARQVTALVQALRDQDLYKRPGVAETLDWVRALIRLGETEISAEVALDTLGVALKTQEDVQVWRGDRLKELLARLNASN
jgi:MoxR-like ATPase